MWLRLWFRISSRFILGFLGVQLLLLLWLVLWVWCSLRIYVCFGFLLRFKCWGWILLVDREFIWRACSLALISKRRFHLNKRRLLGEDLVKVNSCEKLMLLERAIIIAWFYRGKKIINKLLNSLSKLTLWTTSKTLFRSFYKKPRNYVFCVIIHVLFPNTMNNNYEIIFVLPLDKQNPLPLFFGRVYTLCQR